MECVPCNVFCFLLLFICFSAGDKSGFRFTGVIKRKSKLQNNFK